MVVGTWPLSAKDHNATHSFSTILPGTVFEGTLVDPEPEVANGNSTYTLTNGAAHSGKVLDEVYLTLTFKSGQVPALSRVNNASYGAGVSIPGSKFAATVSGQKLHLWYGFQDLTQETKPNYDFFWKLAITGISPLSKVETYLGFHAASSLGMPDLYNSLGALRSDRLKTVSLADLVNDWSNQPMTGTALTTAPEKLIVLVHGWNPQGRKNHYGADPANLKTINPAYSYDVTDAFAWRDLALNLLTNPVVKERRWTVARYDWHEDASTGTKYLGFGSIDDNGIANANASRDAANAHGYNLANLLDSAQRTHIHFVCHSAGNWAARRAAARLKHLRPDIQIQITSLDPFVNDSDTVGGFNLQPAFEMLPQWLPPSGNMKLLENYYVVDLSDLSGGWTSGNFTETAWNNSNLEILDGSYLYEPAAMDSHGGPVAWYAKTAHRDQMRNTWLRQAGSDQSLGFLYSLAVREASFNDAFASADTLDAQFTAGSRTWFNYRATKQASEPNHSGDTGGRSLWGTWTARAAGTASFDTYGSDFYTTLAVYSGASLGSLVAVASDSSQGKGNGLASVSFTAVAGQTYRIAVDGVIGQYGKIVLNPSFVPASGPVPTAVAISTPAAGTTVSGTWAVTATASGATSMRFFLDGELQTTVSSAPFTWDWITGQTSNSLHALTVQAYNGTTLLGTSAALSVTVANAVVAVDADSFEPNDSSTTATVLNFGQTAEGRISSSTDVDWFKIQVSAPGILRFNLGIPPGVDYDIELYGGTNPVFLAGSYNDTGVGESITYHAATVGTYYVRVYGYPFGSGSFSTAFAYALTANLTNGAITLLTPPQSHSVPVDVATLFRVVATSLTNSPLSYQWRRNGGDIPGATDAFYVTSPLSVAQNGDQYTVRVMSEFNTVTSDAVTLTVTNPAAILWNGAISNDWNTAGNWNLNRIPAGTDVVRITSGVVSTSSLYGAYVIISGGQVTLTGSLSGNVTVVSGGTLVIDTSATHDLHGTLTNAGTVVWKAGSIRGFTDGVNSAIINQAGAVFEVQSDDTMFAFSGHATSFTNAGTLRRTTSAGGATVNCAFTNTGTVLVQTGTLYFYGAMNNAGPLTVNAGALAQFQGSTSLQAGTVFSGAGTVRFYGNLTPSAGVTLSGAATVNLSASVTGTINGTGLVSDNLSGTCTIAGSVTLTGSLSGNVTVASGGTLVIDTSATHDLHGTLTNAGTVVWKAGSIRGFTDPVNSAIVNQAGAVFEVQGDDTMVAFSGHATSFTNAGTLRRTTSAGSAYINCAFTNTGTVVVQTGTLGFYGTVSNAGPVTVSAGAVAHFQGGTSLHAATVFSGAGSVRFYGTLTPSSGVTLSGAGSTLLSGSVNGTINGTGLVADSLSGTCTIAGGVTLTGGVFGNANVTVAAGGTLVIDTSATHDLHGTLTNSGTVVWKAGSIRGFTDGVDSAVINQAGAVFEVQGDDTMFAFSGHATSFTNAGTLRRTTSAGGASVNCAFTNTGTIVVQTGALYFNASFTQTDGLTQLAGGALSFSTMNLVGGMLSGAGTVNGNIVNTGGVVAPGGDQAGVLTLNGTYTQGPSGSLSLQLGGTQAGTGFDRLAISGSATLDGTLTYVLLSGYTPPAGSSYAVLSFASRTGDFVTYTGPTTASGFPFGPQVSNQGISLVVGSSLGITSQPVAQTTNVGTGVTFTVAANGSPAPTYQWQRKPNGQSTFTALTNGGSYSGVTTATLTVAAPTLAMSGDAFRCVVSNGASPDVTSNGVVLTVVMPPTITSAASATFTVGQSGSFTVTATGTPAPIFSVASGTFPSWAAFNAATGVINGVPTSAAGSPFSFTIQAANGATPVPTQSFTLTVVLPAAAPLFTTHPQTQLAAVGATVTLSVAATGNPAPTYLWKKNTLAMPGQTNSSLVLANVQSIDAGSYTVVATNASGTATSNAAVLTVATPPMIATHPRSQTVAPAQGFALTVGVTGTAPFTYQWSKDGTAIGGATGASYSVASATEAHQGSYRVTVTNAVGSAVSNAATIALIPAGTLATHALVGAGYTAGTTLTIVNSITYMGTAAALGWEVLLPTGWSLASDGGSVGETRPLAGQTDLLAWAWTTVPVSPVAFTYTVNVPAGATGGQQLAALVSLRQGGPGFQILAKPDPLVVNPVTAHSADTDRNFRIGLIELTRVIELYNTRNGTTRTGAYVVLANSEDGFAADPARTGATVITLTAYHSADTARGGIVRDAKIDLVELTRVIELYNTRSGTVRTGAYRVLAGSEDGFAPGP